MKHQDQKANTVEAKAAARSFAAWLAFPSMVCDFKSLTGMGPKAATDHESHGGKADTGRPEGKRAHGCG